MLGKTCVLVLADTSLLPAWACLGSQKNAAVESRATAVFLHYHRTLMPSQFTRHGLHDHSVTYKASLAD